MEEILRDLIVNSSSPSFRAKGAAFSKPCCYFNLKSSRINWNYEVGSLQLVQIYQKCMKSLKNSYKAKSGFVSVCTSDPKNFRDTEELSKTRKIHDDDTDSNSEKEQKLELASESDRSNDSPSPEFLVKVENEEEEREIFTSILALDILSNLSISGYSSFDSESESEFEEDDVDDTHKSSGSSSGSTSPTSSSDVASSSHSSKSKDNDDSNYFTVEDLDDLVEFITPTSGLANFSLYKKLYINKTDVGHDFERKMSHISLNGEEEPDNRDNFDSNNQLERSNFMITSLAMSVLLETGNLHPEPAKAVARMLKAEMLNRFDDFLNDEEKSDTESMTTSDVDIDIDPIECCNLMRLLYQLDLEDGTEDIQDFLYEYLEQKLYLSSNINNNTTNYGRDRMEFSPDAFLYFLTRAVMNSSSKAEEIFKDLLSERILERLGYGCGFNNAFTTSINNNSNNHNASSAEFFSSLYNSDNSNSETNTDDAASVPVQRRNHIRSIYAVSTRKVSPLNLAFRILALHELGLLERKSVKSSLLAGEMRVLLKNQSILEEGSWPADFICKLNDSTFFGGTQVTNLFLLKTLSVFHG